MILNKRKRAQSLIKSLLAVFAGVTGLVVLAPAAHAEQPIAEPVLGGDMTEILEFALIEPAGELEDFADASARAFNHARNVSRKVLVDLMVTKPQLAADIAKRFEKGYRVPHVDNMRLCARQQNVYLEYSF